MVRPVEFYRTAEENSYVEEFLDALPAKTAQKVTWVLRLIGDLDVIPSRYFLKLKSTDDIWECRISFGSDIYRILCFWHNGNIILTHGFSKKTQKTPRQEIERAEMIKKEYLARKKGKSHG